MKTSPLMPKSQRHARAVLTGLVFLLLAAFLFSFTVGRYGVSVREVVSVLLSEPVGFFCRLFSLTAPAREWTDTVRTVVVNIRLPRILTACLVGAALSLSGTAYQSVFRNPMAAPDILGASSGACFGAALAILLNASSFGITVSAFLFSLLTVGLVYLIASGARGNRVMTLLLAGIVTGSLFSAGTSYIKLAADPSSQLPAITYWMMGSLSGAKLKDVRFVLPPLALGFLPLILLRWRMNLLSVSEEEARAMGVGVRPLRFAVILSATLLTASAVSVSGMIGWIGLVIPHLMRKLVGSDCRALVPASALSGASFLLLTDNLSRCLAETELPIGILTAFIGAPFFIVLMRRERETP